MDVYACSRCGSMLSDVSVLAGTFSCKACGWSGSLDKAVHVGEAPSEVEQARMRREFFLLVRGWVSSNAKQLLVPLSTFGFITDVRDTARTQREVLAYMNAIARSVLLGIVETRKELELAQRPQHGSKPS